MSISLEQAMADLCKDDRSLRPLVARVESGDCTHADEMEYYRLASARADEMEREKAEARREDAEERAWIRGSVGVACNI
jgi:hypothetical protein